jgi:hypothetical protein
MRRSTAWRSTPVTTNTAGAQTLAITGNVYALATPTVTSSLSAASNFAVVPVGRSFTDPLTITNSLVASSAAFQGGLNASFGTPANSQLTTNGGSITNLGAGASTVLRCRSR